MVGRGATRQRAARTLFAPILLLALAVTGCDSSSTPPDGMPEYQSLHYLWNQGMSTVRYHSVRAGVASQHTLQFSINAATIRDDLQDGTGTSLGSTFLSISRANGTVMLGGCSAATFWHVPDRFQLAERTVTGTGPTVRMTHLLAPDNGMLLVADADGGMFRYIPSQSLWIRERVAESVSVTALCMDSTSENRRMFAGTALDGVYTRKVRDSVWTKLPAPPGSIQDLEADNSNGLFAVINNRLYYSIAPFNVWNALLVQPGNSDITDIALLRYSDRDAMMIVGTEGSGIAEMYVVSGFPASLRYGLAASLGPIRRVSTNIQTAFPVAAITGNPSQLLVAVESGLWLAVDVPGMELRAVTQSRSGANVFVATDRGVMMYDGVILRQRGLAGQNVVSVVSTPSGELYCGTEQGTWKSRDEGLTWSRLDANAFTTRVRSGFVMLPARLWEGWHWEAGALVEQQGQERVIMGRVIRHLDELILPDNGGRYSDVLVVRYGQEDEAGQLRRDTYSWTLYFARDFGPVLIEEFEGTTLAATSSVRSQP